MKKFWNWKDPTETAERTLFLNGTIAEESWFDDEVTPQLFKDELMSGSGNITVWINSPGGGCVAAAQIYNMLMDYKGDVTVKIDGIAASAASVIAMAGTKVLVSPVSMLMIHNPMTAAFGNSDEMQKAIEMLGSVKDSIINAYEIKTGLSRTKLSHLMDVETWMDANKAMELGFADGIMSRADETEDMAAPTVSMLYAGMNRTDFGTNKLRADVKVEVGQWQKKSGSARAPPAKMSAAKDQTTKNYQDVNLAEDGNVYTYDFLTSLPDMDVTMLPEVDAVRGADNRVDTAKVVQEGMKNARAVGTERDGKVFVRNRYTGKLLMVMTNSIRHGINGAANRVLTNARLGAVVGDIVQNAVPINALYNTAKDVTGTYAMAGYATDSAGREFAAIITVEQKTGKIAAVEAYDMLHAVSGRQKKGSQADTKSQSIHSIKAIKISISDLLRIVNSTHQSILPEDVLQKFGEQRNPKGDYTGKAKFSASADKTSAEQRKQNDKTALDYFGRTYKWSETGYVLLNGARLDFSGRHEGGPGGYRTVDHRDIIDALGEDYGGMVRFVQEGNIINRAISETMERDGKPKTD